MDVKSLVKKLIFEIQDDKVLDGAAALAFYLMLSIFPAFIALLSLMPYLPVANLHEAVMGFVREALPGDAASAFEGVIAEVTLNKHQGLLSVGLLAAIWSASAGLYAVMQQLNVTYGVKERRPFWKVRGLALLLTIAFGVLVIGAFALIVFGGVLQGWLAARFGFASGLLMAFATFRWMVIALLLLSALAITYYYGPDVDQRFRLISPGSALGVVVLALASLGLRFYVERFVDYSKTYGSLGAVIVLMMWLYVSGFVILLGSELNAVLDQEMSSRRSSPSAT